MADQISRNADFLRATYGVDGTPFFRPPFGVHNADIDRVAADLGYPTITMWSGDVGDSRPENENSLIGNAGKSFQPQQIVITHANLPTITHCYASTARHHPQPQPANRDPQRRLRLISGPSRGFRCARHQAVLCRCQLHPARRQPALCDIVGHGDDRAGWIRDAVMDHPI